MTAEIKLTGPSMEQRVADRLKNSGVKQHSKPPQPTSPGTKERITMTDQTDVAAELAALKARVAELERKGKPSAPMKAEPAPLRDLTAGMSMPPEALREMATAVPNVVIRQIVTADRVKGELAPLGKGYTTPPLPRSRHTTPAPLDVPGIALADRIVDAQDQRDRADLIEREAKRLAQTKTDNAA